MTADHVRSHRGYWERESAGYQAAHSDDLVARALAWGTFRAPEAGVDALDLAHVSGRRVLELGCGGGQFGAAVAALGADVVGLDLSTAQLAHARALRAAAPPSPAGSFELVQASGEELPFAPASFDLAFCDHGALSFTDPATTVAEVARVLRPGGRLVFCLSSPFRNAHLDETNDWVVTDRLLRSYFEERVTDGEIVDFNLTHSRWIEVLRSKGLAVLALHELRPEPDATTTYEWFADLDWARLWPAEDLWVAELI